MAARSALRTLPFVLGILALSDEPEVRTLVLRALRVSIVLWSTQYQGTNLRRTARLAHEALRGASETVLGAHDSPITRKLPPKEKGAAIEATRALWNAALAVGANVSDDRSVFCGQAAAHSANTANDIRDDCWAAFGADAAWLSDGPVEPLMKQPLWLVEVRGDPQYNVNFPLDLRHSLGAFAKFSESERDWKVWLDWYRAILPNGPNRQATSKFGEDSDLSLALASDAYWSGDPTEVARRVAKATLSASLVAKWMDANPTGPSTPEVSVHVSAPLPDVGSHAPPQRPVTVSESVMPQSDEPTADDQLGRRPFARALVERLDTVHGQGGKDGFAVNLHAPWGAGKTSVLCMMEDIMGGSDRERSNRWAVGTFNAWDHEHRQAPWWPFMITVRNACVTAHWRNGDWLTAFRIWLSWWWRRCLFGLAPYLLAIILFIAGFIFLQWAGLLPQTADGTIDWSKAIGVPGAILAALLAFGGLSNGLVFGNKDQAQFYFGLTRDPWRRVKLLFCAMVAKSKRPVGLFIDDLDRCQSGYIVDLLTGVQTHFRHRNLTYIVAADRAWMRASFEAEYKTFHDAVSDPGQSLGHLFLEKIFQVSSPIPGMGHRRRREYWTSLLTSRPQSADNLAHEPIGLPPKSSGSAGTPSDFDRAVSIERNLLKSKFSGGLTRKQADAILNEASDSEAKRAAVALELSASSAATDEIRHALAQFADILPDNPRVMKRMINAYSLRQAIGILEHDSLSADVLARWTILEQRYPAVTDLLADRPSLLDLITTPESNGGEAAPLPELLRDRTLLARVCEIVSKGDGDPLTADVVRSLTHGSVA